MEVQSLTPPEFRLHLGPFVQQVDKALKECEVEHQAYHGGTFVGKRAPTQKNIKRLKMEPKDCSTW